MDIEPGSSIPEVRIGSVSAERMKTMAALLHDPNPIHIDVATVQRLGLGDRVVNQGMANLGPLVNALNGVAPGATLERLTVRYLGNVFAGDTLVARGRIESVAGTRSEGYRLTCSVSVDREGEPVVSGMAIVRTPPAASPGSVG